MLMNDIVLQVSKPSIVLYIYIYCFQRDLSVNDYISGYVTF